jgi:hypothetical protein
MPLPRENRSQTTICAQDIAQAPLLPRVVTPMTRTSPPPRVPTPSQNLSPRNLSQDAFYGMDTTHMAIALGNHHWSQQHQSNAVVHPVTGKEMEYMALMKDPRLQPLLNEVSETNAGDFSKEFETFQEPTHVYLSNSQTSQKTERSLTAK